MLKLVEHSEYLDFCRKLPAHYLRDTVGHSIAAAEWIDDNGVLLASALYQSVVPGEACLRQYRIAIQE